jgi:hypothetical protein
MALTRDFKESIIVKVKLDPEFAKNILDEAVIILLNGEAETKFKFC